MQKYLFFAVIVLLAIPLALANTYVADIVVMASQNVYTINERVELKGFLYLTNYTDEGAVVTNHTGQENATLDISFINKVTNATPANYSLNTTTGGEFYSQSDYRTDSLSISAPSIAGDYYMRINYTDPNSTEWYTKTEIHVVNQTLDRLKVSTDKVSYDPSESMKLTIEAIREVGDRITYVSNVSVNGSIRNSAKTSLSTFTCTTGSTGKCTVSTTAPSSYGDFYVEVNNYKAFSSFEVIAFSANIYMKDELGKSIKHTFDTAEQASVEVKALSNSTSETYTFDGVIQDTSGNIVKSITSTTLNYNNSYTNRFTFTLDALNFPAGTYQVDVNVTKSGGTTLGLASSFEVRSWSISMKKRDTSSGFDYEYSAFPNRTVYMEAYPAWRVNGSIIDDVNTTTSLNVSLKDSLNNEITTAGAEWNSTCGSEGCYEFSFTTPSVSAEYTLAVTVSYNGESQTARKKINVIGASMFAQTTDREGTLKELFGTSEHIYIAITAKNTTSDTNMTAVSVDSVVYMNGTEYSFIEVADFDTVNSSNDDLEWAWNSSSQMLKLDPPKAGGIYTLYLTADNNTAAASTRIILNPYDVCLVAKNTAGQAGAGTSYYYVYQFKTTDTVYFELSVTRANNPTGRASALNGTNSSYGFGSACADESSTKQAVNNATITVEEVVSTQSGKVFSLNTTETACQADDNKGKYTCTVKGTENWDGSSYGVKFKIIGEDSQTSDITYGGFEARAFYLYAYSSSWRNKPSDAISLTVDMYEAGNNWWGSYGSGGLTGTVSVEKIEYQGRDGEWIWPPISYDYNVSLLNTTTISNGRGTLSLPANYSSSGTWKTGYYRAILKGTDSGGTSDYGYAWFSIRNWEAYASPVECEGGTCNSVYNINAKNNISLYVTINNAGEWGQNGNSLGGNVIITVKKIQDCRKWPCTELNSSKYNATNITVASSSGWYWSGNINTSYLLNITPVDRTWNTGYWQVVLDINNTETGSGWFNTIAFYAEVQPTNASGTGWKYSIKNNEHMYFKATTVRSQKSGYYYGSYNTTDYINTTISNAMLRAWDPTTYQSVEYSYPDQFNITIINDDGSGIINGTRLLNVTYNNGSWPSGYYNGELTLKNDENETATAWLWFQVRPFRVSMSSSQYSIDNDVCINGTLDIYEPDWSISSVLNGTYNISSVIERTWNYGSSSITTYTNFTPSSEFNGSENFTVCPNSAKWGSGSWGNYHYLTVRVQDDEGNSEEGWLSFRTVPFSVSWGSIVGGTNIQKTANVVVPATLTKASTGASASGNLSRLSQWRSDTYSSTEESYVFSVGSCYSNVSGSCAVSGTENITIYPPNSGWKDGYNYLQAVWTESDDSSSTIQDYSNVWFNGVDVYNGWWNNVDENGNWKYNFGLDENLTIRLYARDSSNNAATVNITKVEYVDPSSSCWSESCRSYTTAAYSVVGQANNQITDNGIIRITKPSANWSRGYVYVRATVSGAAGTAVIKNGNIYVKELTPPTVNVTAPAVNDTTGTSVWVNWTTSETSTCYLNIIDYQTYQSWYCTGWNSTNSTNATVDQMWVDSCNVTMHGFAGSNYTYEYISKDYRSWNRGKTWSWSSGTTGLSTGGTSHYYQYNATGIDNQSYGIRVSCSDEDWNYGYGSTAFHLIPG